MLELVSLLVETLTKVIPGLKGFKDKSKYSSLGADLLIFYNQVNVVVAEGYELLSSLRVYVERMENHLATGNDPYALTAGHWMYDRLRRQSIALRELQFTFVKLWDQLSPLLNVHSFQRLLVLMERKTDAVRTLTKFVETGRMPLDTGYSFDRLAGAKNASELELQTDDFTQRQARHALMKYEVEVNFVLLNVPWEEDILRVVKEYLEIRRPEEQLDQICEDLEFIRQAITENFELKDVILKVSDWRRRESGFHW